MNQDTVNWLAAQIRETRIAYKRLDQGTSSGDKHMKVLDKDEKKIYEGLKIPFRHY